MKHLDGEGAALSQHIANALELNAIAVSGDQLAALTRYTGLLIAKNRELNLTRIQDPESAAVLHIADSLTATPEVQSAPEGGIYDLGTGGGLPGLPLAVATGRPATLADSVGKKAAAVADIAAAAGLSDTIDTSSERAEDHARRVGQRYAVVTARAVAKLPSLVELAAPLLVESGILVALKGDLEEAELESGRAAGRSCAMELVSVRRFVLEPGGQQRAIVVFRRTGKPMVRLPRRVGLAQSSPLV